MLKLEKDLPKKITSQPLTAVTVRDMSERIENNHPSRAMATDISTVGNFDFMLFQLNLISRY